MASILQDIMLEALLCSVCKKYLSALPVKVYHDNVKKCGRCCDKNDEGVVSIYNGIVEKYLFKCINRYDGCNKLLSPADVLLHEENCTSSSYKCPKCEDEMRLTAYELLQHYKTEHASSILTKNIFIIPGRQILKERYLYIVKDNIFFILVESIPHEKVLYLSAVSLKCNANVTQMFSVNLVGGKTVNIKTPSTPCSSLEEFKCDYYKIQTERINPRKISCVINLDLFRNISYVNEIAFVPTETTEDLQTEINSSERSVQTIPLEDMVGVKLSDKFKKEYPGYQLTPCGTALFKEKAARIELTCSNCKQFTGCNVFNCKFNQHLVCWECNAWCGICNGPIDGWDVEISSANELLLLPCKWKCGLNFSGDDIRNHEATCAIPLRRCPEKSCRTSKLKFQQLKTHMLMTHKTELVQQLSLAAYLRKGKAASSLYLLQNGYLFKMIWSKACDIYTIRLNPLDDADDYELYIIFNDKSYKKLIKNEIDVKLEQNPKIYLKMLK